MYSGECGFRTAGEENEQGEINVFAEESRREESGSSLPGQKAGKGAGEKGGLFGGISGAARDRSLRAGRLYKTIEPLQEEK